MGHRADHQVSISSGVEQTECWNVYNSLKKRYINSIATSIYTLEHRCADHGIKSGQKSLKYYHEKESLCNLLFVEENFIFDSIHVK